MTPADAPNPPNSSGNRFDAPKDPFGTTGPGRGDAFADTASGARPQFNPGPIPASQTQAAPRVAPPPANSVPPMTATAPPAPAPSRVQEGRGTDAFANQPTRRDSLDTVPDASRLDTNPDGRGARRGAGPEGARTREKGSGDGKLWRQLAVVGCLIGTVIVAMWLRQGLDATPTQDDTADAGVTSVDSADDATASDQEAQDAETSIPLPLNTAEATDGAGDESAAPPSDPFNGTITVADFPIVEGMRVGVLGSDIRTDISVDATTVEVATPADITTIIGLWEGDTIRGMTIVNQPGDAAGPDQNTISPSTTAQSLVALYPGVLTSDVSSALNRSSTLVGTDSFIQLSDAIRDRGGVLLDTPDIAIALSGAINALPPLDKLDPSCGTNAPNTVASGGGVCFSGDSPPVMTNETERWNVMLDASSKTIVCGAVAPKGQAKSVVGDNCGTEQLVVGPGPVSDSGALDDDDRRAVQGAAGLHSFAEYGLVLNDLIFGTESRTNAASDAALVEAAPQIVQRAVALSGADAELAEQGLILGALDSEADRRVTAIISMSRAMMFSDAPTIVGQDGWSESSFAVGLTNLYQQSTEWVSRTAAIPSWSEPAVTIVDVTGAGAGATGDPGTGGDPGTSGDPGASTSESTGTGDANGESGEETTNGEGQ